MELAVAMYEATKAFPADEHFGLRLQLRRAAVSIPSNLAEGHGRVNRGEYARFVSIARGSLKECETQLLLSQRLGLLSDEIVEPLLAGIDRLSRLVTALKRRLRAS